MAPSKARTGRRPAPRTAAGKARSGDSGSVRTDAHASDAASASSEAPAEPVAEPIAPPRCDCPALDVPHTHEQGGPEPLDEV